MFEDFLKQWNKEKEWESTRYYISKHGEAYMLSWCFYFFLGKELNLSNKEYQELIANVIGPRMFSNIDRSNCDQVLKAIEKECTIHSTK